MGVIYSCTECQAKKISYCECADNGGGIGFESFLGAVVKTAEFKFYNQAWFSQYKLNADGEIEFIANGSEFKPKDCFSDG